MFNRSKYPVTAGFFIAKMSERPVIKFELDRLTVEQGESSETIACRNGRPLVLPLADLLKICADRIIMDFRDGDRTVIDFSK